MTSDLLDRWSVKTLGDCADWYSGGTPDTDVPDYWGGDIPWITASSLHAFYLADSERRVTPLGLANGTRLVPEGAILFVVRGMSLKTEFRLGIARRPVAFGQDCKALVAREGIEPLFLAYAIRAKSHEILGLVDEASHGTGRLQTDALKDLEIDLPPLPEQRAIAAILGALDDKIELNRRMNQTLEATAQALFQSWFVDFDPVRAKAEGRQPTSMDAETAALFPDSFKNSEFGEIPGGWRVATLGSVITNPRRVIDPRTLGPETPYIGLEHMPRRSITLSEWGTAGDVESGKARFQPGEILFGKLRPYFHKVGIAPVGGVCSTDILCIAPWSSAWFGFVLGHVNSVELIDHVNACSTGTRMPRASWADIAGYEVAMPEESIASRFTELVLPLTQQIRGHIMESRTLATIRDTLLPKLLSGELRVQEAEVSVP